MLPFIRLIMGVSSLRLEPRFGGVFSCPPRAARGPQGASRGDARDVRRAVRLPAQALYPRRLEDGARQSSRMRSGRVRWQRRDAAGAATGAQRTGLWRGESGLSARSGGAESSSSLARRRCALGSLCRLRCRVLPLERFRAAQPPFGHPAPCRLARGVAGELGHLLAFRGVSAKFLRWIHGPPRWASGRAETPFAGAQLFGIFGQPQPAQSELTPPGSLLDVRRSLRQLQALAHPLLIDIRRHHAAASRLDVSAPTASIQRMGYWITVSAKECSPIRDPTWASTSTMRSGDGRA